MDELQLKALIDKCLTGKASPEEQQQLEQWYASFDNNPGLLEQLTKEQQEETSARMLSGIKTSIPSDDEIKAVPLFRRYRPMLVACSLILIIGISWYLYAYTGSKQSPLTSPVEWVELTGVHGKSIKNTLPDGSVVWLNGESKIKFDKNFHRTTREVWLEGEGYFEVAHLPERPFKVHAGDVDASVLGTEFNIKRSEPAGSVIVTVTKGRVSVEAKEKVLGVLGINDQIVYNNFTGAFTQKTVEAASQTAWIKGSLVFKEKAFKDIVSELEQKFDVKVKFANPGLGNCLITASFDPEVKAKDILFMLCKINGSQLVIDKNIFTISGRPCKN